MKRVVLAAASLYAIALLAEGCLGVAHGLAQLVLHTGVLAVPGNALGTLVFFVSVLLWAILGLTPLLPKRIFAPAIVFPFLASLVAAPLGMVLASRLAIRDLIDFDLATVAAKAPSIFLAYVATNVLQAAVGAWTVRKIRRAVGGKGWILPPDAVPDAPFRWKPALLFVAANVLIVVVGLPLYGVLVVETAVNSFGRGFVVCDHHGISVVTQDYARDGKTVSLVGMMHVSEKGSYDKLIASIDSRDAVLLAEGVTDEKGLLHHKTDYKKAASTLGLESQVEAFHPDQKGLDVEWGDVDVSVFSPRSIDLLNAIFRLYEGDFSLGTIQNVQAQSGDPEAIKGLFHDILEGRNEHLLKRIDEALVTHGHVVVPWGAYHLPDLGLALEAKGFKVARREERPVVNFSTIFGRR